MALTPLAQRRRPVLTRPGQTLILAMLLGAGLDLLAWNRPAGLGLSLVLVGYLVVVAATLGRRLRGQPGLTTLLVAAAGFASVPTWRASPTLTVLGTGANLGLVMVLLRRAGGDPLGRWTTGSYLRAMGETVAALADPPAVATVDLAAGTWVPRVRRLLPWIRGIAAAAVVLAMFGLLFGAADPIFADIVAGFFTDLSIGRVLRWGVVTALAGWVALGCVRRTLQATGASSPVPGPQRASTEVVLVLSALNLLFGGFLAVQFAYLFDGEAGRVGLGYAEYARRGFFELVTVAALVVGLALSADWISQTGRMSRRRVIDLLQTYLVIQTLVVMASAVIRMKTYTDQFGLTELRVYTSAFMLWTGVVLVWMLATVFQARRDRFALGAFASGLALAALLVAVNPDALIARVNLARGEAGAELDLAYLETLSADVYPALADRRTDAIRRAVSAAAQQHLDEAGWRSWSFSEGAAAAPSR